MHDLHVVLTLITNAHNARREEMREAGLPEAIDTFGNESDRKVNYKKRTSVCQSAGSAELVSCGSEGCTCDRRPAGVAETLQNGPLHQFDDHAE